MSALAVDARDKLAQLDLLTLLPGRYRHVARTRGGEYAGGCPWCGGRDRFRVWPHAEHPAWWCRGCGKKGDAITLLRQRDGLSFAEACAHLGLTAGSTETPPARKKAPPPPVFEDAPPATWQARGERWLEGTQKALWAEAGAPALAYLRQARGLTDETIRRAGLGYLAADDWQAWSGWGLPGSGKFRISKGIVIPCREVGSLWYLKLRRPLPGDDLAARIGAVVDAERGKYAQIPGSRPGLYGARTLDRPAGAAAFYVEGEFDQLLLAQEAGDLAGAITMGSASLVPTGRWLWGLRRLRRLFAAQDRDTEGAKALAKAEELSARVRRAPPVGAKDLTEMHLAGGSLRRWASYHLDRDTDPEPEPTPPPEPEVPPVPTPGVAPRNGRHAPAPGHEHRMHCAYAHGGRGVPTWTAAWGGVLCAACRPPP